MSRISVREALLRNAKPLAPAKERKPRKLKFGSRAWWRMAGEVAMGFAPQIQVCVECHAPICWGYCCERCGSSKGGFDP